MPPRPEQFFSATATRGAHRAVLYTLPSEGGGEPTQVLIECLDRGSSQPRQATSLQDLKANFQKEMEAIASVAKTTMEALHKLAPGEIEIEFGVELGGSGGIPLITKTEGKANFKVTLKWNGAQKPQEK